MVENVDETFEKQDTQVGSLTTPSTAGQVKVNGLVVIKGRPCKVVDYSVSKTGKHGHAKCAYTGIDIFNGRKYQDSVPSTHAVELPNVYKSEYTYIGVNDEGYVSLMDGKTGEMREDLKYPDETDDDKAITKRIQEMSEEGKTCTCSVLKCMGEEKITDVKENN